MIRRLVHAATASVAACLLAGLAGDAHAQAVPGLSPESVMDLQIPEDPQISRDGRRIAFVRRFVDVDEEEYSSIFLQPADGGRVERLTDGPRTDLAPRFSPDGRRLAWIGFSDGFWEIRVRDLTTGRTHALVPGSHPPGTIAWSPAGDRIAYTRLDPDPGQSTGAVHVFVVPASGGTPLRVTGERIGRGDITLDTRLAWVGGGRAIVLSAAPDGDREIIEIELAGGLDRALSRRRGPDVDPAPDRGGDAIAFAGAEERARDVRYRLFVVDRSGAGVPREVPLDPGASVSHPIWSPDGRSVYAILEVGETRRLVRATLDGGLREVAATVHGSGFDVSADSVAPRIVSIASRPDRPPEVFVWRPEFPRPSDPVTTLNFSIDPQRLGRPVEVRGDGDEMLATAILPPGIEDLEGLPEGSAAVVDLRADAARADAFDVARQVLAGAGVVVAVARDARRGARAVEALTATGQVAADRVFLLTSASDSVPRDGVASRPAEAPYAAAIDWGTIPLDSLHPRERVSRLEATIEWLRARR